MKTTEVLISPELEGRIAELETTCIKLRSSVAEDLLRIQRIEELERALKDAQASNSGYLKQWKQLADLLDKCSHDMDMNRAGDFAPGKEPCIADCPRCAWEKMKVS